MYQQMLDRQVQLNPGTTTDDWVSLEGIGLESLGSKKIDYFQLFLDLGLLNPIEFKIYWEKLIAPMLCKQDYDKNRQSGKTTNAILDAIYQNFLGRDVILYLKDTSFSEIGRVNQLYCEYLLELEEIYGQAKGITFIGHMGEQYHQDILKDKYFVFEVL